MKERPILFSAPMVRALLAGTKTQTRRVVKPQPEWLPEVRETRRTDGFVWPIGALGQQCGAPLVKLPYGVPGDRLIVRETFRLPAEYDDVKPSLVRSSAPVWYAADGRAEDGWGKTRVSIHMPRWASRLTLKITDVRVERLQDISALDAMAEGLTWTAPGMWSVDRTLPIIGVNPRTVYAELWEHINGPDAWDANPWVWAVSFEVVP